MTLEEQLVNMTVKPILLTIVQGVKFPGSGARPPGSNPALPPISFAISGNLLSLSVPQFFHL